MYLFSFHGKRPVMGKKRKTTSSLSRRLHASGGNFLREASSQTLVMHDVQGRPEASFSRVGGMGFSYP